MKKVLASLFILASVSALAFHPGDDQRLTNIGTGTKLKVLTDINIIPNGLTVALGKRCFLQVKEKKTFDRVLAAESILTITSTIGTYAEVDALTVDNSNISYIYCFSKKGRPTIGDLKEDTNGILEVHLADPTRI